MQIYVKTLTGKILTIDCEPSDTIEKLKIKIQDKEGIPSEQQCLFFDKKILEKKMTIKYYNIKENSTMYLILKIVSPGIFYKVIFKDVEYKCPAYKMSHGLKEFMSEQTKIPIERIGLVIDYVLLGDKIQSIDSIIKENSKIFMVVKNFGKIKINVTCDGNQFEIECTEPLNLIEIKKVVNQSVDNLNDFDLLSNSDILTEEDDLEAAYKKSNNFIVVRRK